ncbi:hypothetical protein D9599_15240 [Roseomonas sp. KE2513]|nr:hypothetical protein [Roseomonas sp. KE2513]
MAILGQRDLDHGLALSPVIRLACRRATAARERRSGLITSYFSSTYFFGGGRSGWTLPTVSREAFR